LHKIPSEKIKKSDTNPQIDFLEKYGLKANDGDFHTGQSIPVTNGEVSCDTIGSFPWSRYQTLNIAPFGATNISNPDKNKFPKITPPVK
jgi:hypothetical protein